jgi:APA family basic amino acid/polyamine antiporter
VGVGCALAGLCYAEFASTVPVAGSVYTYAIVVGSRLIDTQSWNPYLSYGWPRDST